MWELEAGCVESEAWLSLHARAVDPLAHERVIELGEVDADLVGATGEDLDLERGHLWAALNHAVVRERPTPLRTLKP